MILRAWVGALLIVIAPLAQGGFPNPPPTSNRWELLPANPTTRDHIVMRNLHTGCTASGLGARQLIYDGQAQVIQFIIGVPNDVCTGPAYDEIIDTRLGYLAAGTWTVRFIHCWDMASIPDPATCTPMDLAPIIIGVAEAGLPRHVIPSLSSNTQLALFGVLALIGAWFVRLRR